MLRSLVLGLMIIPLTMVSAANAHGPTRQKVTKSVEINAPAAKVWEVMGNFLDMSWHPAIEKTEGEGGNEPGAKRTLTLKGGGEIHESLLKYDGEGHMMKYEITDVDVKVLPVKNYSAIMKVEDLGDGKSKFTWRGAFYRGYMNNNPPPELNDEAAVKAITGVFEGGMDALKKKLEAAG